MVAEFPCRDRAGNIVRTPPGGAAATPDAERRRELRPYTRPFSAGDTPLFEGDDCGAVYLVFEGWLALQKSLENGQDQIIDFVLAGDIADPAGADGHSAAVTIRALTDGSLAAVPRKVWEERLANRPDQGHSAHLIEAARQARHAERILRLGKGSAEMRVGYALAEFCVRIEAAGDRAAPEFHVPLTQQQLGDYVGLSSVHVCRTMRRMARNGVLEMSDHMDIRILDPQALARLAGVDLEELKREILAPPL